MAALKILSSPLSIHNHKALLLPLLVLLLIYVHILGSPSPLSGNSSSGTRINYRYISLRGGGRAYHKKSGKMLLGYIVMADRWWPEAVISSSKFLSCQSLIASASVVIDRLLMNAGQAQIDLSLRLSLHFH